MSDGEYEFKDPVEFTVRLEKEQVEDTVKSWRMREVEYIIEDVLGHWFENVVVLDK